MPPSHDYDIFLAQILGGTNSSGDQCRPFSRAELGGFLCPAGEPSERVLDERIYEQGLPRLDLTIKTLRNEISDTERSGHDTSARRR